ncbi:MAG TPA: polysaccharide deacetylase family protein, partial [Bacteroidota bacterium]|nr:polysaccharide deacetylase family protein [Bacteroidota bacterium]
MVEFLCAPWHNRPRMMKALRVLRGVGALAVLSCIGSPFVFPQEISQKVGGVAFRVDDDHDVDSWAEFAAIFAKYGYHFTLAQNLGRVAHDDGYFEMIRRMQDLGHELADHSPNHTNLWFTVDDTLPYSARAGVDHISGDTVFLAWKTVDTSTVYFGEGVIDIRNGMAFSRIPGGFRSFSPQDVAYIGIYLPSLKSLYGVGAIQSANTNDQDTLELLSIWGEHIPVPDVAGVACQFVRQFDLKMSREAIGLLVQRTQDIARQHDVIPPVTWIQPGGRFPVFSRSEVKQNIGDPFEFVAASSQPYVATKCFNEVDESRDKRFGMEWGDFMDDTWDARTIEAKVADKVAKHFVLVGQSHLGNLTGSWQDYLAR